MLEAEAARAGAQLDLGLASISNAIHLQVTAIAITLLPQTGATCPLRQQGDAE